LKDRIRIAQLLTDRNKPWTLVAVTNDPILACQCDRIFVMKDGAIIEEGNFEQIKHSVHFSKILK
jgi:ABC-type dipeptide/oligopeptide/nickel transport system ATPase component